MLKRSLEILEKQNKLCDDVKYVIVGGVVLGGTIVGRLLIKKLMSKKNVDISSPDITAGMIAYLENQCLGAGKYFNAAKIAELKTFLK